MEISGSDEVIRDFKKKLVQFLKLISKDIFHIFAKHKWLHFNLNK